MELVYRTSALFCYPKPISSQQLQTPLPLPLSLTFLKMFLKIQRRRTSLLFCHVLDHTSNPFVFLGLELGEKTKFCKKNHFFLISFRFIKKKQHKLYKLNKNKMKTEQMPPTRFFLFLVYSAQKKMRFSVQRSFLSYIFTFCCLLSGHGNLIFKL